MDVGSTKDGIVKAIKNHPNRPRYVATHPMWGTENSILLLQWQMLLPEELP